ncbi:MAG: hypothetical protein AAGC46_02285 [Solirubrobacteraceae bacterium]
MHWLTHPRIVFAAALAAAVLGVVGESVDASVVVHLASVVCVVVGLVVLVLSIAGDTDGRPPRV